MTRGSNTVIRTGVGVAVMASLWVAGLEIGGLGTGMLFLAPAFVLLLPLLAGRYPGERALVPSHRRPLRRGVVEVLERARPPLRQVPRGGLLVGCSLAGRAPPLSAATCRTSTTSRSDHFKRTRSSSMHRKILAATAIAALAAPAAASAHVTLQPNQATAGAFTKLDVRVPTERDNASTVKIDVRFPAGFASVSYEPKPGWKVRVIKSKLATPIQTDDGPITEGVTRMIWTGTKKGLGKIAPGQFMDFPISVQIPGKAGDKLTFKALQTYSNGEVVRWIGAPNAAQPAPQVTVLAAAAKGAAASGHAGMGAGASSKSDMGTPAPASSSHASASEGLGIAALVVGGLGLVLGGAAFGAARRGSGRRRGPVTA